LILGANICRHGGANAPGNRDGLWSKGKTLSPSAGMASWRRRRHPIRSSSGCNRKSVKALSDATIKQKLAVQGLDVHYLAGPAFATFIDQESEKWSKIIREAGINKP
jgi:hypothetical protein